MAGSRDTRARLKFYKTCRGGRSNFAELRHRALAGHHDLKNHIRAIVHSSWILNVNTIPKGNWNKGAMAQNI
jgi:hypothetical protein